MGTKIPRLNSPYVIYLINSDVRIKRSLTMLLNIGTTPSIGDA